MTKTDTIVSKPGFLTIRYHQNPGYIYFDWENFQISLADCVDAFAQAEQAIVEYGVFQIISDVAKVKTALKPEVAQWWGEVCLPSLAKCGVTLIVNLLPASANAQPSSEVMHSIIMQKAYSVKAAEALVRAFQSGKAIEKEQFIKADP